MFLTIGLVGLVVILLVVLAAIKRKPAPPNSQSVLPPQLAQVLSPEPARSVSLREQQSAEDAALMADEFRKMQEEQKRAAIRESLEVAAAYAELQAAKRKEELQKLFVK